MLVAVIGTRKFYTIAPIQHGDLFDVVAFVVTCNVSDCPSRICLLSLLGTIFSDIFFILTHRVRGFNLCR